MDAVTGQIVAALVTDRGIDDGSQVGPLLDQMADPVASFTGDGAYDRADVTSAVLQRHPEAAQEGRGAQRNLRHNSTTADARTKLKNLYQSKALTCQHLAKP